MPLVWWGRPIAEMRWQAELLRLLADPIYLRGGEPRGDGRPVVLVPGFAAGDWTLSHLWFWLRRTGYRPAVCRIHFNAGCPERALVRVEQRVAALAESEGRRVAVVGHSRGGHLARVIGARRPELVSHVVAMGSGLGSQFEAAAPALAAVALARAVESRGGRRGCMTEDCGCGFTAGYRAPFPEDVRLTSIYSKGDGMVRWSSCVVPYADNVEITGSHVGLAWNRKAYTAIAAALDQPEL
jgi:pimeloyl-ACP methyl ester carboxylesterase